MDPILPEDADNPDDLDGMSEGEAVKEILSLQNRELEVRQKEIEFNKHESDNNRAVAEQSIAAQLEDNKIKAEFFNKRDSRRMRLAMGVIVVVAIFLLVSMHWGQTEFAYDIFKVLVGAVAGFFIGKNQKQPSPPPQNGS